MISIGRRFYLKGQEDGYVKIRFTCVMCKKRRGATVIDDVVLDISAGRIVCNRCDMDAWVTMAIILLKDERRIVAEPRQVALEFNVIN